MGIHLNTLEASQWLGIEESTMIDWRLDKKGPPYIEISRRCVRYAMEDLIEWRNARRRVPSVRATLEDLHGSF